MKQMRDECAADVTKFCKDVLPGKGRILACLNAHLPEVMPSCRPYVEKAGAEMKKAADQTAPSKTAHTPTRQDRKRQKKALQDAPMQLETQ